MSGFLRGLQDLNWTESERSDAVQDLVGQVVEFHRITSGVQRNGLKDSKFLGGERWPLKRKDDERVLLERNEAEKDLSVGKSGGALSADPTGRSSPRLADRLR
jgi:hypothetical protein